MKKYITNLLEKLDLYDIFRQVFKYFIAACGVTFLLCFFNEDIEIYSRENAVNAVTSVFLVLCIINFLNSMTLAMIRGTGNGTHMEKDALKTAVLDKKDAPSETNQTKRIVAVHEAGHAVMAYLKNAKKYDIDIIKGCTETDFFLADAETCKVNIMVRYSGAIAEDLVFGCFCSGSFGYSTADFESATNLIKGYITMTDKNISKTLLEEEVRLRIIETSKKLYEESEVLLKKHKDMICRLAEILMEKDSLKTEEIKRILEEFEIQE